jgi:hypothetical protein
MGQTTHKGVVYPPRRSFAESPYYKRTKEQKDLDLAQIRKDLEQEYADRRNYKTIVSKDERN